MNPVEMLDAALAVAAEALQHGELPIAAVVFMGDDVIAKAYTQERTLNRRLVHAELLAMTDADHQLRWQKRDKPLRMAVTLEPCLMCLGAAATLGVSVIYFGLESPGDGAAGIAATWQPTSADLPGYKMPVVVGGINRARCKGLFQQYCDTAKDSGIRRWAMTLVGPVKPPATSPTDPQETPLAAAIRSITQQNPTLLGLVQSGTSQQNPGHESPASHGSAPQNRPPQGFTPHGSAPHSPAPQGVTPPASGPKGDAAQSGQ